MHLFVLIGLVAVSGAHAVEVRFNPSDPSVGPFPSDALTTNPGGSGPRQVALPLPDCAANRQLCADLALVNRFDGFHPQQTARIRFTGAIQPETLRDGVFFVALDFDTQREAGLSQAGAADYINEVRYHEPTRTAYFKPDTFLDQSRAYVLVVTDAVRDEAGRAVTASAEFRSCTEGANPSAYCVRLAGAVGRARSAVQGSIVAASVYTTMTVTAGLEAARAALERIPPAFQRMGAANVLTAADLRTVTIDRQVRTSGDRFESQSLPLPDGLLAQSGIGRVAFSTFRSPRWLGRGVPAISAPVGAETDELVAVTWLPSTPMPSGGYPVVISGHGIGFDQYSTPVAMAVGLASQGYAVISINAFGHGGGPDSRIRFSLSDGSTRDFRAGGRGEDFTGRGEIGPTEGAILPSIFLRDSLLQTALDLSQLVRAIQAGMDLDGVGRPTLDAGRISYYGQSLGSFYGSLFLAVEPGVKSAALNVGGDSMLATAQLSPGFRDLVAGQLGLAGIRDLPAPALRYRPVQVLRGATEGAAVEYLDLLSWIEAPGAPGLYATHFKSSTLPGVPIKRVLFQYVIGDQTVPNPTNTALVRAANLRETTSVFRFDRLRPLLGGVEANPHGYLATAFLSNNLAYIGAAVSHQLQAAAFFAASDERVEDTGRALVPLLGVNPFETPAFLTEDLNF